ncbi:MAG TPA: hypothetical protein VGM32_04455, partial [Rhodopila sp.]
MDLESTDLAAPTVFSSLIEQTAAQAGEDVGHWLRTAFQARQAGRPAESRALLEAAALRFPL